MGEYRNNSERRKNAPVELTDGVRKRKKNALRQAMGLGDINRVSDYAVNSVIIPSLKRTLFDVVTNGLRMLLDNRGRDSRYYPDDPDRRGEPIPYRSFYGDRGENKVPRRNTMDNFDDFEFASKGRAVYILSKLQDFCVRQNYCEVARLFAECGDVIPSSSYWDYGWTDLDDVEVVQQSNDWWIIDLPPARFLGNRKRYD